MYYLTDTEDTIHPPTPEEDAAYNAQGDEIAEDAVALMATVRHLLTGMEIDTLEAAIDKDGGTVDMAVFESLRLQFYAQMCNHKDRRANA
jgi:hypothetical protein